MCSAIGAIGEGVLTNRIRLCILDMNADVFPAVASLPVVSPSVKIYDRIIKCSQRAIISSVLRVYVIRV